MSFRVRAAQPADAVVLAWLEAQARQALVDARGGPQLLTEQPEVGDWQAAMRQPQRRVWVAEIDQVVVGYVDLVLPPAGGIGIIGQIYVEPGARELGFGDELLGLAIEATRAAGGTSIESFALPGDRQTKNLFERAAMTARKLVVSKPLD